MELRAEEEALGFGFELVFEFVLAGLWRVGTLANSLLIELRRKVGRSATLSSATLALRVSRLPTTPTSRCSAGLDMLHAKSNHSLSGNTKSCTSLFFFMLTTDWIQSGHFSFSSRCRQLSWYRKCRASCSSMYLVMRALAAAQVRSSSSVIFCRESLLRIS